MKKSVATLAATAALSLAAALSVAAASPSGGSCRPEDAQPAIPGAYRIGVLDSRQGSPRELGVIHNVFTATLAKLQDAAPGRVQVLSDQDAANPAVLSSLKVVVLPESKALSSQQRRALMTWVRAGGGLVSLYFSARNDEHGTPLIRLPQGWGGASEWAELSPAYGARFVNDVFMQSASFAFDPANPVTRAADRYCGGPLPDYAWRRGTRPIALTGEMAVAASRTFAPLATLKTVRITWKRPERRARPGTVFAWTHTYRAGRVVSFGLNFMDSWQPWTYRSYYAGIDPMAPWTGVALLRGSVDWAAGA